MKSLLLALAASLMGGSLVAAPPAQEPAAEALEPEAEHFPVDAKRRWRMERSDRLKQLELEEVAVEGGFVLYVQKAYGQPENYHQLVVDAHLPWLRAAEQLFAETLLTPAGIQPATPREPIALLILHSQGDLDNYLTKLDVRCQHTYSAGYDPVHATLALVNLTAPTKRSFEERRRDLQHGMVHALWQAHAHRLDSLPGPSWLTEGSAVYLASAFGGRPDELNLGAGFERFVTNVAKGAAKDGFQEEWLVPVEQIAVGFGGTSFDAELYARIRRKGPDQLTNLRLCRTAATVLFFRHLMDGNEGALRPILQRFLPLALAGASDASSFEAALDGLRLETLAIGYWKATFQEYLAANPTYDLDAVSGPEEVVAATLALGAKQRAAIRSAPSAVPTRPASEPPATAAPSAPEWSASDVHAHALFLASRGQLSAAVERLSALRDAQGGTFDEAYARSLARLEGLAELRRGFLVGLAERGERLRFQLGDDKLNAKVLEVTADKIRFEERKRVPAELDLDALGLADLASLTARQRPPLGTLEERALIDVLLGDKSWTRDLRKAQGTDSPLETELFTVGQQLPTGAAVDALDELFALAAMRPGNPLEVVAATRRLAADSGRHALVADHRETILRIARKALGATATDQHLLDSLHAAKASLEGQTLHLEYDFESEEQLADFVLEPDSLTVRTLNLPAPTASEQEWYFRIQDGALRARGSQILRHVAPLVPPIRLDYSRTSYFAEGGEGAATNGLLVLVCDDLHQSFVAASGFSEWIMVSEGGQRNVVDHDYKGGHQYDTEYHLSLQLADGVLTYESEVSEKLELETASELRGYTQVFFLTDAAIGVTRLTLEGQLDEAGRAELSLEFADAELRAMGLL